MFTVKNKKHISNTSIGNSALVIRPMLWGAVPRPSTAPGLGVCEWSPEGLHDKSVSLIPNTDEILKFMKKKN